MVMDVVNALLITVVIVAVVLVWKKTVGRFSGYLNGVFSVVLCGAMAYIVICTVVAIVFRGATSVEEILGMFF